MKIRSNYKVVVEYADCYGRCGTPEQQKRGAEIVLAQVKRHVDFDRAIIESDEICSFCNSAWEVYHGKTLTIETDGENVKEGDPLCCKEAFEEHRSQHGK